VGMTNDPSPPPPYEGIPGHHTEALTAFRGQYLNISFQDGPIREYGRNGTTNEDVIQLVIDRIRSLNEMYGGRYRCEENDQALHHLTQAKAVLEQRTRKRIERGVEGTSEP
jgi:hypothetical protein